MKPPQIAITVDSPPVTPPRVSSDFEEIDYPTITSNNWQQSRREEELPLHYMTEDTARRRVVRGPVPEQAGGFGRREKSWGSNDEGKDVYSKIGQPKFGSGRPVRRAPPPPPTTFVCCELFLFRGPALTSYTERVP